LGKAVLPTSCPPTINHPKVGLSSSVIGQKTLTMKLNNNIILITGGATGIGRACVQACLAEGARVMIAQPTQSQAQQAAEALGAPDRVAGVGCDVSQRDQVQAMIAATVQQFGRLDALIHSAALVAGASQPTAFLDETDAHWGRILEVNLTGAFLCAQVSAKQMLKQGGGGSIVLISSVAEFAAQELAAAYCTAKSGLGGLTKVAAIELGARGIRVNNIAPGDIDTHAAHASPTTHGASGKFMRHTPLGRRGDPIEVGRVAAFLASDDASFVTGATWLVDGGFLSY
jgi:NAD(P)-dependent dehydrogenase (short-subunit alcohol dehydrogenase family)